MVLEHTRVRRGCAPTLLVTAWLLAGCSAINESDEKQCSTDDQCVTRFGNDVAVSCVDSYCVRPACVSDQQCAMRGDRYRSSICGADGHCASAESATAACTVVADCKSASPTTECINGRCEDKIWGCRGQPDERPPIMNATATLQGRVFDVSTRMPVVGLTAKACLLPTFDPDCARPLPGTASSYDRSTGMLTMTGIPQETPIRLKLDFPAESGLIPLDQYSTRTAHDVTNLPLMSTIATSAAPSLIALLDPPRVLVPGNTSVSAVVLNCRNEAAMGVEIRIADADKVPGTEVLYFGADGQVAPTARVTEGFGSALIINVKPSKLVTVQTWVGELMLNEYRVIAFPRCSITVHFYPRVYPDRTSM